jgi:hypothetical protein
MVLLMACLFILGFRARFLMMKRTDSTGGWVMLDTARDTYNDVDNYLYANHQPQMQVLLMCLT